MIYLNVSATQTQAEHEVAAYQSVGFHYAYNESTTPTNANYATNVQAMQSAGAQYVTEYSDAVVLAEASAPSHAAGHPARRRWSTGSSEEYSPQFAQQTTPESNGNLVLMSATAAYREASANPGLQLMESWMNWGRPRLPPGHLRHPGLVGRVGVRAGGQARPAPTSPGPPSSPGSRASPTGRGTG